MEEGPLMEMNAEQFRDLVQNNDKPDSCLKTDEYRFGDEIGDEAQP
jgi:hypothetical protein